MKFNNETSKIVITGGSGFLGSHLLKHEMFREALVIGRKRPKNHQHFKKLSFDANDSLAKALKDKDILIHMAARAHVMKDTAKNPLNEYRMINTVATLNLATQAALAGIKRFIFISSIKVLGEQTLPGQAFKNDDPFNPQDPYSISKVEAEIGLKQIGEAHDMEIIIIRPPLVYGQGVKGNFANLLRLARLPIPLPLGSIQNKRSLVSVENLIDLIIICLDHPNAKNQKFLVSDDDDMSTPSLFLRLAESGGYKAYIFKFPMKILNILLRTFGKLSIYERLCSSMQVDIEYTKLQLDWKPPNSVQDSLNKCWISYNDRN